jgi:O-antigen/teichoic acid export membrane protein
MNSKSQTAKNLLWQFVGQGGGKVSMFFFYVLLPAFIGASEYGKFAYALAVSSIVAQPIVEMGLDMVTVKWVSRGRIDVTKKVFIIRIIATLIAFLILFTISLFLKVDKKLLFVLFSYFVLMSFQNVIFSFFRGIEKMKFEGMIVPIQKLFILMLLFVFAFWGFKNAFWGSIALLFSTFLGILLLLFISRKQLREIMVNKVEENVPNYNDLIKEGVILGGVTFLWLIYFRIDTVMLGIMKDDIEVGIYNVAYKLMEGVFFIPGIMMLVFFPSLTKREKFNKIFGKLLFVLGGIGLGMSVMVYLFSSSLIRLIYGSEFFGSIAVLQILALAVFPVFLGHLATQSLVALDLNRIYLLVAFIGMLLNISLNYLLIPRFGANGAAWATVATEMAVVLLCGYFVWREKPNALNFKNSVVAVKEILSPVGRKFNL